MDEHPSLPVADERADDGLSPIVPGVVVQLMMLDHGRTVAAPLPSAWRPHPRTVRWPARVPPGRADATASGLTVALDVAAPRPQPGDRQLAPPEPPVELPLDVRLHRRERGADREGDDDRERVRAPPDDLMRRELGRRAQPAEYAGHDRGRGEVHDRPADQQIDVEQALPQDG